MARPNTRRASRLAAAADSADAETEPQDDLAESPVAALEVRLGPFNPCVCDFTLIEARRTYPMS